MENNHPSKRTQNLNHNLKSKFGSSIKWQKQLDFHFYKELKEIDLTNTFLSTVTNVICATGLRIAENELCIRIYRFDDVDLKNEANPINIDEYILLKDISIFPFFKSVLKSTEFNRNMEETLEQYDFSVKIKGKHILNHHCQDLPKEVIKILDIYKENYKNMIRIGIIKKEM